MNQIQPYDPVQLGAIFAQSGMFPDARNAAQCATKLAVGQGLGLTPYDAMAGLHVINGKVVLAANLMAAAIKRSGKYDYRAETTTEYCRITFVNLGTGEEIGVTEFSMQDAGRAGLGGANWKKFPKAMLFARAISAGYREHCPDALGAAPVYVESEGETELGVSLEEHKATQESLPASPPPEAPHSGGNRTSESPPRTPTPRPPLASGAGGGDAVNEDGSHNIVQVELDVELQSKAGKTYTKHFVHLADGSKMGTMKRWVAVKVMNDYEAGKPIRLEYTETQWGSDLEGHEVILPESGKAIEPEVIEPVASQDELPF